MKNGFSLGIFLKDRGSTVWSRKKNVIESGPAAVGHVGHACSSVVAHWVDQARVVDLGSLEEDKHVEQLIQPFCSDAFPSESKHTVCATQIVTVQFDLQMVGK